MHIDKKALRNLALSALSLILLWWLLSDTDRVLAFLSVIWRLIAPFAAGASIAFVFNVPMRAIERQLEEIKNPSARRTVAILITLVLMILILALFILLLIPQIEQTADSLVARLPGFFEASVDKLYAFLEEHPEIKEWITENVNFQMLGIDFSMLQNFDWASMIQKIAAFLGTSITTILGGAFSAIGSVTNGLINTFLSVAFAFYALARKEILARQGRRLLYSIFPEHFSDEIIRVLRLTNSTFSNFISGQCLEACILGGMFAVAMLIFGMPYIPLVSVIIAVTALVPIVGAFVGCIVGAFFILVESPMQAVWFVVLFLVLQQIEGNLIYPRVVGTSIGLPGMWVLAALTVGSELAGVMGMLVMIPLTSVVYALLREFTQKRVAERGIDPDKLRDHPPELKSKFREKREKKREQKLLNKMKDLAHKTAELHKHDTEERK